MKVYSPGALKLVEVRTYEGIFDGQHQWEFNGYTIVECRGLEAFDVKDDTEYQMIEERNNQYVHKDLLIGSIRLFPSSISKEFNRLSEGLTTSYQIDKFMKKSNLSWIYSAPKVLKKNR